jgi:ABC-type Fe3+-siderophore transport system permease subunit
MATRVSLFVLAVAIALALAPTVGPTLLGPSDGFVFWQLRVPRVIMGGLVGATLGLTGGVFQLVFVNPLATPSTVGTTAGATLGALAALVLGASGAAGGLPLVVLAAFAGALSVSLLVAAVAAAQHARVNDVLLAGIAASLGAGAIAAGLQYAADLHALFAATQWSLGHLPQVGYRGVLVVLPFVLVSGVTLLGQMRGLESLAGGEELAHGQGVDVPRLRSLALGAGALGVAACVAWCGPIAFVGLIVPHLVRLAFGARVRLLLPLSLLGGSAFLVVCDTFARLLIPGRELPVGVLTAALGAPALVWLIARRARHGA